MLLLLALACTHADDTRTVRHARSSPPGDTVEDTGEDTGGDTAGDTAADTDPPADGTQACWLGPARDHGVCVPVVPWDASFGDDYAYPDPYEGSPQYAAPARYVDLDAVDADLAIAPNFVLSEYMAASKGRWGVMQAHVVDELQAIRDDLGDPLTVTSGYRDPAYNAGVGGVPYSRHQYGDAADLDASGWSVEELGDVCDDEGADYVGLYEDGHTHCDWRDHPLDPAFYDAANARPAPPSRPAARLVPEGAAWTAPAEGFDEGEPFRRWTALDADGRVIVTATGRAFLPPPGTARIRVVVGGQVVVER